MELEQLDLELLPLLGALLVIFLLGFLVGPVVRGLTNHIRPYGAWNNDVLAAGRPIGLLETTVYMLSIISGNPVFIGGWLDRLLGTGITLSAALTMVGAALGLWLAFRWMHEQ